MSSQTMPFGDSTLNPTEYKNAIISATYNKREKVVEFYWDNVLKYKMKMNYSHLVNWTISSKLLQTFFLNGKLKSRGTMVVVKTATGTWLAPFGRHLRYWKNGRIKEISHYTEDCSPISDSLFYKNGRFRKIRVY
ncbi:MAG: hypothetical protein V4635_02050 [Bacteroidota bacterium]